MLDYRAIEQAVASERNAGGFALLMQQFQALGVQRYDYLVAEGLYRYYDADSHVDLKLNGVGKIVALTSDAKAIQIAVKKAQAGELSFEKFCELAGKAGVTYWCSDLQAKNVAYYDQQHQVLLKEPIPGL